MKYDELVKALRGKFITYDVTGNHNSAQIFKDAADAIEKLVTLYEKAEMDATNLTGKLAQAEADMERLQAENPIVETVLVDKMRQQMEETVCHCNVKENAELIARILDDDVDGKVFELPKHGEWDELEDRNERKYSHCCSVCHRFNIAEGEIELYNYCPNCGAKMEVQDG